MWNVVNIRGTSGSGKSTVARGLIANKGGERRDVTRLIGGRERFMGSWVGDTFFVGKYATDCGGCDGLSWKGSADDICDIVFEQHLLGHVVLEGLLVSSWGTGRLLDLWERCEKRLHVIMLTTPLEVCLESVNKRRREKALSLGKPDPGPVNPENTTSKYHGSLKGAQNLQARGMTTIEYLDRDAALARALELLK